MKKPTIKDKAVSAYVDYIEERLSKYEKSPYVKTYLTLLNQLNDFNEQLTIQEKEVDVEGVLTKVQVGRIDLFGTKDEKEFERGFKYMLEVNLLLENLEKIRKKMTEDDKVEIKKVLVKEEGVEEFISENGNR